MTDAAITTICSAIGLAITFIGTEWFKYKRELLRREQDRLDAEQKERTHLAAIASVAAEGGRREQRIIKKIDDNTEVNVEALNAANGLTGKIAASTALVEKAISAFGKPQEINVTIESQPPETDRT